MGPLLVKLLRHVSYCYVNMLSLADLKISESYYRPHRDVVVAPFTCFPPFL